MSEQFVNKVWGLALDNVAAMILGAALMLWYVYVKLKLDDVLRDSYATLQNIENILEEFHDKAKKR